MKRGGLRGGGGIDFLGISRNQQRAKDLFLGPWLVDGVFMKRLALRPQL
jgi:hypothetical protein